MSKIRRTLVTSAAVFTLFVVLASGVSTAHGQTVVASTSLTGALARAAGASDVRILTPADVKHPPEYELRPSDIAKIEGATAVVYAGYERMVARLVEVSKGKSIILVQVDTTTAPDNFITQARKIAAAIHTEKEEQAWEKSFTEKLGALKSRLAPYAGKRAVVHMHAQGFAAWAGLSIVQVIPPGEISPKAITDAVAKQPDIVVDILHMPVGKIVADNARCRYAQLINFPGVEGTSSLEDIFEYDAMQVVNAFKR